MSKTVVQVGPYKCGPGNPLLLIAGPCVLQDLDLTMLIARQLKKISGDTGVNLIFKASFDKANRTSIRSFRGPGLAEGLQMLNRVRDETGLPVVTDIHEPDQASAVGEVCDLVQIPAFLCRQTDLLLAAAKTGRALLVKKGQFLAPRDMKHVVEKLREANAKNVILCERGTFFGYGRLVNDMRALPEMRSLGVPVAFDATHSVQEPGGLDGKTGGNREMVEPLARAAIAVGVDALFFETHPNPAESPSDGPNMVPLDQFGDMISRLTAMRSAIEPTQKRIAA